MLWRIIRRISQTPDCSGQMFTTLCLWLKVKQKPRKSIRDSTTSNPSQGLFHPFLQHFSCSFLKLKLGGKIWDQLHWCHHQALIYAVRRWRLSECLQSFAIINVKCRISLVNMTINYTSKTWCISSYIAAGSVKIISTAKQKSRVCVEQLLSSFCNPECSKWLKIMERLKLMSSLISCIFRVKAAEPDELFCNIAAAFMQKTKLQK